MMEKGREKRASLHIRRRTRYSGKEEVRTMTDRSSSRRWLVRLAGPVLLVALLLFVVGTPARLALAQEEPFVERVLRTLTLLPEDYLPALVELMGSVNVDEALQQGIFDAPRDFLASQEEVLPIELPPDAFQVTVLNFMIEPGEDQEDWFGVAAPLEGLIYDPKGVGIMYPNVGIFIQEAHEAPPDGGETLAAGPPTKEIEDMLGLTARLTGDVLERLRAVMKALDRMEPDDPERVRFLSNVREYLLRSGITLPAADYRIVALDFQRAAALDAVHPDEVRPGLAVLPEGIGVFFDNMGVFIQLAI